MAQAGCGFPIQAAAHATGGSPCTDADTCQEVYLEYSRHDHCPSVRQPAACQHQLPHALIASKPLCQYLKAATWRLGSQAQSGGQATGPLSASKATDWRYRKLLESKSSQAAFEGTGAYHMDASP